MSSKAAPNSEFRDLPLAWADIADSRLSWQAQTASAPQPDEVWQRWLFDSSSLTQLLKEKSGGDFRVDVGSEEWLSIPNQQTRGCFGPLSSAHKFWSRKVILVGNKTPWVLAHTLIPEYSLDSPLGQVLELNDKPLGEYLFSHPELIRSGMDISRFAERSWARRSLFYLYRKPIMVAEFFLPTILD